MVERGDDGACGGGGESNTRFEEFVLFRVVGVVRTVGSIIIVVI